MFRKIPYHKLCEKTNSQKMLPRLKRKALPAATASGEVDSTEDNRASISPVPGNPKTRGQRLLPSQRRQVLEDDEWTLTVEEYRVQCRGCKDWIKLNTSRAYDRANWNTHRLKCKHISGLQKTRAAVKKGPKYLAVSAYYC